MNLLVEKTMAYMKERQAGETTGHDWWHSLRVHRMALRLAASLLEPVDMEIVELGALLHDIDDWKLNGGDEEAGPRAAASWLASIGARDTVVQQVPEIIRSLSFKGGDHTSAMPTLEGMVVQDADRLDAVGAVGIARCFTYGGAKGQEIFNPGILARVNITEQEYSDQTAPTTQVNHFFEKLLVLKELYNTPLAKEIGKQRHDLMVHYLQALLIECGAEDTQQFRLLAGVTSAQSNEWRLT